MWTFKEFCSRIGRGFLKDFVQWLVDEILRILLKDYSTDFLRIFQGIFLGPDYGDFKDFFQGIAVEIFASTDRDFFKKWFQWSALFLEFFARVVVDL